MVKFYNQFWFFVGLDGWISAEQYQEQTLVIIFMHTTLVKYMQRHALTLKAVIQLVPCSNSPAWIPVRDWGLPSSTVPGLITIMLFHVPCHMTPVTWPRCRGLGCLVQGESRIYTTRTPHCHKWHRIRCSSLFKAGKKELNPFPVPSPNPNPNLYTEP